MRIMLILLCFFSLPCFSGDKIKIVKTCQLKKNESVQLLSLRTIDGDTLYLKFRNVITGAFLDTPTKSYDFFGDVVLSQCINGSLIFALEYGSPYIKGCLVTGWENGFKGKNSPEGFCFAERNIPEAVWFGKNNILIIIRNQMDVGTWKGKYIIYDNAKKSGERAYSSDNLPSKDGYIIFALNK
ncbi:hypothetical protein HQH75_04065 [Escherichia coli]|nr:hypothetical protein [Escherichia coli]MBF5213456.1 hypothetical protein [Escherichia coli]MBF5268525.1 hypothetical protein [Escherichia coli]MBF5287045.1 hypothetical protein [Escherichia coli]MBF5288303.1 hypothetical protein [Escherichia coli]